MKWQNDYRKIREESAILAAPEKEDPAEQGILYLELQRGLTGMSDEDRSVIETMTNELLTSQELLSTLSPRQVQNYLKRKAVLYMANIAEDLKKVIEFGIEKAEDGTLTCGVYTAQRLGGCIFFWYRGTNYMQVDMTDRYVRIVNDPRKYRTAMRMVRTICKMCSVPETGGPLEHGIKGVNDV